MKLTIKTPAQWRAERRAELGQDQDEDQDRDQDRDPNLIPGVPAAQTRRALKNSEGRHDDIPF